MTGRRLPRVRWWGWALLGWAAAAAAAGPLIGRCLRRPPRPVPQLDRPLALPDLADADRPSLPGAILRLSYATDETTARYWLTQCARRGADWATQRELWDRWHEQHDRDVTRLFTDPTDPEEDDNLWT